MGSYEGSLLRQLWARIRVGNMEVVKAVMGKNKSGIAK